MCGQLDVCVMYVNIFQVFCLFSITSGGSDWLCYPSGYRWCVFLYSLLSLCPVLGFDFAQQIKLIAFRIHLKRNEDENENENEIENAQSLLISHIFKFIESNQGSPVPSGNAIKVLRMLLWLLSGMAQIFTMPVESPASSRDNQNIDVYLRVAIKINVNTNRFLCFPVSPQQYGFVNYALELLVLKHFGDEIWEKIK